MRFIKVFKLSSSNYVFYICLQFKLDKPKIFKISHVKINNSYIVPKILTKRNIQLGTIYSEKHLL